MWAGTPRCGSAHNHERPEAVSASHLDDVVSAEDAAGVASIAMLPDGALHLSDTRKQRAEHQRPVRVTILCRRVAKNKRGFVDLFV